MSRAPKSALVRWSVRGLAGLTGATALIGLLHLPVFGSLLGLLASATGCPVSLDGVEAHKVEALRRETLAARRGSAVERGRPALGFVLGDTTRDEVARWLGDADCTWLREQSAVQCEALVRHGAPLDLYAQFDAGARLVAVDVFRTTAGAQDAVQSLERLDRALHESAGARTLDSGPLGPTAVSTLAQARFARVAREYRYQTYLAKISATNLGERGIRVREQYQWLPLDSDAPG